MQYFYFLFILWDYLWRKSNGNSHGKEMNRDKKLNKKILLFWKLKKKLKT